MKHFKTKKELTAHVKSTFGANYKNTTILDKDDEGWFYEIVKNGESIIESPCSVVHSIAGKMKGKKRGDVIKACMKAGITFYTARTQYQNWKTKHAA